MVAAFVFLLLLAPSNSIGENEERIEGIYYVNDALEPEEWRMMPSIAA